MKYIEDDWGDQVLYSAFQQGDTIEDDAGEVRTVVSNVDQKITYSRLGTQVKTSYTYSPGKVFTSKKYLKEEPPVKNETRTWVYDPIMGHNVQPHEVRPGDMFTTSVATWVVDEVTQTTIISHRLGDYAKSTDRQLCGFRLSSSTTNVGERPFLQIGNKRYYFDFPQHEAEVLFNILKETDEYVFTNVPSYKGPMGKTFLFFNRVDNGALNDYPELEAVRFVAGPGCSAAVRFKDGYRVGSKKTSEMMKKNIVAAVATAAKNKHETEKETKHMTTTTTNITDELKDNAKEAARRTATRKARKAAKLALVGLIGKDAKSALRKQAAEFLDTELGEAIMTMVLGTVPFVYAKASGPKTDWFFKECRVQSLEVGTDKLGAVVDPVLEVLTSMVPQLPGDE